jgi:hypothetical protein
VSLDHGNIQLHHQQTFIGHDLKKLTPHLQYHSCECLSFLLILSILLILFLSVFAFVGFPGHDYLR